MFNSVSLVYLENERLSGKNQNALPEAKAEYFNRHASLYSGKQNLYGADLFR
jgi:hypothetical protein